MNVWLHWLRADSSDWGVALVQQCRAHLDELRLLVPDGVGDDLEGIPTLRELLLIPASSRRAQERITALEQLALQASELACMEYDFLYDKPRRLFAIGYNVTERHRDASYYDLLASEARLCNFVTIAQEQVPQESWFALGRLADYHRWRTNAAVVERLDV